MMGCSGSKDGVSDLTDTHNSPKTPHATTYITMNSNDLVSPKSPTCAAEEHPASGTADSQDSIREEVMNFVHSFEDAVAEGCDLPLGEEDYVDLLKRWLRNHSGTGQTKSPLPPGTDLNRLPFPVPEDNTGNLRPWLQSWEPVKVDIEGESAWTVLPQDVIKNGFTTPEQQSILAARSKRRFLFDPDRMQKRREELARYFTKTHRIKRDRLVPYLAWADLMLRNQVELEELCNKS